MSDREGLRLSFDAFELDEADARLTRAGEPIAIPPRAFDVLCALARRPGRLVTKDELLDAVWGHRHVSESVLKTAISQLRTALDDSARQPRYIETAARRGYRFKWQTEAGGVPVAPAAPSIDVQERQSEEAPDPSPASRFIGRRSALLQMREAWAGATRGNGSLLWISGEAGIGKTSLVENLLAGLGNIRCAHGQCVEQFGADEPYLPMLDALNALCMHDPALPQLLRQVAPMWLLQLPWLSSDSERQALQGELAGVSPERMMREMSALLDAYTTHEPLLLVIEDLHWSDQATVRLLDYIARRRRPSRFLWIGTFRPAELLIDDHPLSGVRRDLRARRLCRELMLEPFSEQEVAQYLASRLPGSTISEALARSLHARSDGLPLFVAHLVDDLCERSADTLPDIVDERAAGALAPHADWRLPDRLNGIIESQIDRLSGELRALLSAASVSGMEFLAQTVADAIGQEVAWVQRHCDRLARRLSWLDEISVVRGLDGSLDTRYAFRHAIYRQVLYHRMSETTRCEIHHRIALSLRHRATIDDAVTAAELATHFEQGQDFASAVKYYCDAATNAMTRFAARQAATYARRGLALLARCQDAAESTEAELTLETQRGLACMQFQGVASPEAIAALGRARALCEHLPATPERAWVLNGIGWVFYTRGDFADACALAQCIHEYALDTDDRVLFASACNLLGVTTGYTGNLALARDQLARGISTCAQIGDRQTLGRFMVDPEVSMRANISLPLTGLGLIAQAQAQCDAACDRADKLGQPMARMLARWCLCILAQHLDDADRVERVARELNDLVEAHSIAQGEGPGLWYGGWAQARSGQAMAGYEAIMQGYERHVRLGMYTGCPLVLGLAAKALELAADRDGALQHLRDALTLAGRIGETVSVPRLLLQQARLCDDIGLARASVADAIAQARRIGALGDELAALVLACSLEDAGRTDVEALRAVFASLPGGFDATSKACALQVLNGAARPRQPPQPG